MLDERKNLKSNGKTPVLSRNNGGLIICCAAVSEAFI